MTLKQLADFVTQKVNQQEAEDKTACQDFLKRRMEMIWNDQLWKDSLVELIQAIDPATSATAASTYLPTKGVLLLPLEFDRVLGVRVTERALSVIRPTLYYRRDFDIFNKAGTPWEFDVLPACVWEFDTAKQVQVYRPNAGDMTTVTADLLDTTNSVDVARSNVSVNAEYTVLGTTDRIDAVIKPATTGAISLQVAESVSLLNNSGSSYGFEVKASEDGTASQDTGLVPHLGTYTLTPFTDPLWAYLNNTGDFVDSYTPTGQFGGSIIWNGAFVATKSLTNVLTLAAADTTARLRQRIRLMYRPDKATTIRVLGKRRMPTFSADSDQPCIQGVDNALIAFAQGDMLERERQYGKAQLKFQEAVALLDQLKAIETVQQAHNLRVTPDQGYGDPNDLYSHPPLQF